MWNEHRGGRLIAGRREGAMIDERVAGWMLLLGTDHGAELEILFADEEGRQVAGHHAVSDGVIVWRFGDLVLRNLERAI